MDSTNRPTLQAAACTGCGLCVAVCPCGAVTLANGLPVFRCGDFCDEHPDCPAFLHCQWPCEDACPTQAISCSFEIVA